MTRTWKWAIAGAVVVLLSFIASGAIQLQRKGQAIKEADAGAHRFLVTLQAHQYQAAYAMLDTQKTQKFTLLSMREDFQSLEKTHRLDWVAPACDEYHPNDSLTIVILSYSVGFGQDSMPVRIKMTRAATGWRVSDYRFNESPA